MKADKLQNVKDMDTELVLKPEILKTVKKDNKLQYLVNECLGFKPSYFQKVLNRNDTDLTKASVLQILKDHFKVSTTDELLTIRQKEPVAA